MLGGDQSETMEDDRSLGPGDPQSPTLQPRSMISNSPQSLHSAFAESLSLIESGSSTECNFHRTPLRWHQLMLERPSRQEPEASPKARCWVIEKFFRIHPKMSRTGDHTLW